MQSLRVMKHFDGLHDRPLCLLPRQVHVLRIDPLGLELAEPTFARRIVPTIPLAGGASRRIRFGTRAERYT